jgi:DNA ligase-1
MKDFAQLVKTIDSTNKTNRKVEALSEYFLKASDADKVWTIAILSHRRPPRPVNSTLIRGYASELADIPLWLFEESYHIVGDLAETIALVVPEKVKTTEKSLSQYLQEILRLKPKSEEEKKEYLIENWSQLNYYQRFVFTKLITGGFRIGVSQKLMTRALSKATGIDEDILAFKLMGNWDPNKISYSELILEENEADYLSKPYPFYLAYPIEDEASELGNPKEWIAEHKWDGIRSQLIVRKGQLFVWSRGEELVTDKYPEFEAFTEVLPDGTVLDGEILPYPGDSIGDFKDLQTRIGRKNVSKALLKKLPVILKAYDILEYKGEDIRSTPFEHRREILDELFEKYSSRIKPFHLSETMRFSSWEDMAKEREKARDIKSEGLMIKKADSSYGVGRKKGDWWKWKSDPFSIDAVLTYAMRGHGRRSNLFTDYTFALWNDNKTELVTFAKAYSGLTDKEFKKVDAWIKKNTIERFGPVRSVEHQHVFEIAFEGIAESKRHKSGIATRFPRILRWRQDKKIEDANTLEDLKAMIPE